MILLLSLFFDMYPYATGLLGGCFCDRRYGLRHRFFGLESWWTYFETCQNWPGERRLCQQVFFMFLRVHRYKCYLCDVSIGGWCPFTESRSPKLDQIGRIYHFLSSKWIESPSEGGCSMQLRQKYDQHCGLLHRFEGLCSFKTHWQSACSLQGWCLSCLNMLETIQCAIAKHKRLCRIQRETFTLT